MIITLCVTLGLVSLMYASIYLILTDVSNTVTYNKKIKKLNSMLRNVLYTYCKTKDYDECNYEIEIAFREFVLPDERLKREFPNISILLEKHILNINLKETVLQGDELNIDSYKKSIREFLMEYNQKNPLEQIKGTDYVVLKDLINCLEEHKVSEGKNIINQVAIEIKALQDNIMEKEKDSRKQDIFTKTGIILSIVFGMMTFIQFFV